MRRRLSLAFLVLVLTGPALAAEGRIPLSTPTILAGPGHYYVTRDIVGDGTGVFSITADGVTVDLNGFTLSDPSGDVISITGTTAGALNGVTIRNGRISGGYAAIYASSQAARRIRVEGVVIEGTGERGILIENADVAIVRECVISDTADSGIEVHRTSGSFSGKIVDNQVTGASRSGILLDGLSAGEVRGNQVLGCGAAGGSAVGILLDAPLGSGAGGNLVVENLVSDYLGVLYAIHITDEVDENLVRGNVVRGSAGDGFVVESTDSLIVDNVSSANTRAGIWLGGGRNLLDLNQISGNGQYGLFCADLEQHAYRDNMLRGNVPSATSTCVGTTDAGGNLP